MLSTLLCPTGGEAKVLGYDLAEQQEQIRQNIGCVSQAGGADLSSTGLENLVLQAQLYGLDDLTAKKYASEFVERFQMSSFIDETCPILFRRTKAAIRHCAWNDSSSAAASS